MILKSLGTKFLLVNIKIELQDPHFLDDLTKPQYAPRN